MSKLEDTVIEMYRDGNEIKYIIESLNITHKRVKQILIGMKESNRHKRTFTDEFKKIIAERDMNGISRRQISLELEINANTVRKACEKFGQTFKERASSDNEFTRIDGKFDLSECPSCKSKDVNEVEDNTIYCMSCGDEFIIKKDHALKINWEYVEWVME